MQVSKFPQVKAKDKPLEDGLQYSYIKDGHVFSTEGATLRWVRKKITLCIDGLLHERRNSSALAMESTSFLH